MDNTLVGVVVGAVITAIFSFFQEKRRKIWERQDYLTRKKEETYQLALSLFISMLSKCTSQSLNFKELHADLQKVYPSVWLYASKEISSSFDKLNEDLCKGILRQATVQEKLNQLVELMRKDIGQQEFKLDIQ